MRADNDIIVDFFAHHVDDDIGTNVLDVVNDAIIHF